MPDLIVTHHHGMLAAYVRNGAAELTQRVLIDIGDDERTARELIEIVDDFAARFGWETSQQLASPVVRREPLPPQLAAVVKRKGSGKGPVVPDAMRKRPYRPRISNTEARARRQRILDYITSTPDVTISDVAQALFGNTDDPTITMVRSAADMLRAAGQLTRDVHTRAELGIDKRGGNVHTYRVVSSDEAQQHSDETQQHGDEDAAAHTQLTY